MEKQSKKDLNIMYKRILVPTDGTPMSEKAVEGAARFAKSLGASLVLITVVEPYSYTNLSEYRPVRRARDRRGQGPSCRRQAPLR